MSRARRADRWFQLLETLVHRRIFKDRKNKSKRVRVAILDTGVDCTHPTIRTARDNDTIVGWFPDRSNPQFDPLCDQYGHGTHGTSVLMKIAPNAEIYVARVANEGGKVDYDYAVKVRL